MCFFGQELKNIIPAKVYTPLSRGKQLLVGPTRIHVIQRYRRPPLEREGRKAQKVRCPTNSHGSIRKRND